MIYLLARNNKKVGVGLQFVYERKKVGVGLQFVYERGGWIFQKYVSCLHMYASEGGGVPAASFAHVNQFRI